MSMRRLTIFALVASLIYPSSALAEIKPGDVCKKIGITSTVKNIKYTCIKSGLKLVWGKPVAVLPITPKVVPTPSPTPSPTPTQSAAPTATPSSTPTPTLKDGDSCSSLGQQIRNIEGILECRFVVNNKLKFFQVSLSPATPGLAPSPESLETCRAPDMRTTKSPGIQAIAYPVTSAAYPPNIPITGNIKVAIIPIDFSDVPGAGSPSEIIDPEIKKINEWVKQFSNGKMTYEIQTSKNWIRASKDSSEYVWIHPGPVQRNPLPGAKTGSIRTPSQLAEDLMASAQNSFDYTNVKVVFFVYPKNIVNIWDAMTSFGGIQTNKGYIGAQINATGAWLYQNKMPIWSWFIHENMHPHGLAGHAPSDGSPFNLMTNQAGLSLVLDAWDQLILDWQIPDQFYCVSVGKLEKATIKLSPLERDEIGTKAIMVRLSSHEVLIIESRRRDKWSSGQTDWAGLPVGFYGLLVYKVDTAKDSNRVETGGFADFISNPTVSHESFQGGFDANRIIYEGETLVTNGVSITLTKSGDHDQVTISKS
jgi:hypothetical protein